MKDLQAVDAASTLISQTQVSDTRSWSALRDRVSDLVSKAENPNAVWVVIEETLRFKRPIVKTDAARCSTGRALLIALGKEGAESEISQARFQQVSQGIHELIDQADDYDRLSEKLLPGLRRLQRLVAK